MEIFFVCTLVLKPHEKSCRRAKLVSRRQKDLVVPDSVARFPYSLACPELFLVRCLGGSKQYEFRLCPASANPNQRVFHPLGLRRVTWRHNRLAEPHCNTLILDNPVTGEVFGEHRMNKELLGPAPEIKSDLGDEFELSIDHDSTMTMRKGQNAALLLSMSPYTAEVVSLKVNKIFEAQLRDTPSGEFLSKIHQMLLCAWRRERFECLGLIPQIRRSLELGTQLDDRLMAVATGVIQDKIGWLHQFLQHLLEPINTELSLNGSQHCHVTVALNRTKAALREWRAIVNDSTLMRSEVVLGILSQELVHLIPIDGGWWMQIQTLLSPEQLSRYERWLSVNRRQTSRRTTLGFWKGWDKDWTNTGNWGLMVWEKFAKGTQPCSPYSFRKTAEMGKVDFLSRFKLPNDHLRLHLCNEYPWFAFGESPNRLLQAAEFDHSLSSPHTFSPSNSTQLITSLSYSDQGLAAQVNCDEQGQLRWKVVAARGWLTNHKSSLSSPGQESSGLVAEEGRQTVDPFEELPPTKKFRVTQIAASRTHLFILRTLGSYNSILRIPIPPTKSSAQITMHRLADRALFPVSVPDLVSGLMTPHIQDPRYSTMFSFAQQLQSLYLAQVDLTPPEGFCIEDVFSRMHYGQVWWRNLTMLRGWQFSITLTAVKVLPTAMRTDASTTFKFEADQMWLRMIAKNYPLPNRLLSNDDATFQFRWKYTQSRMFGIWLRDSGSHVIFACKGTKFVVAAHKRRDDTPLGEVEWLVPTSMRGDGLPMVKARCHSWRPNEPFVFKLTHLKLTL